MDELEKFREDFRDHAENDARNFESIRREIVEGFKIINEKQDNMTEALKPLTEAYNGILFSKKFLTGVAGIVLAIAAIGGAIIWVINASINK